MCAEERAMITHERKNIFQQELFTSLRRQNTKQRNRECHSEHSRAKILCHRGLCNKVANLTYRVCRCYSVFVDFQEYLANGVEYHWGSFNTVGWSHPVRKSCSCAEAWEPSLDERKEVRTLMQNARQKPAVLIATKLRYRLLYKIRCMDLRRLC